MFNKKILIATTALALVSVPLASHATGSNAGTGMNASGNTGRTVGAAGTTNSIGSSPASNPNNNISSASAGIDAQNARSSRGNVDINSGGRSSSATNNGINSVITSPTVTSPNVIRDGNNVIQPAVPLDSMNFQAQGFTEFDANRNGVMDKMEFEKAGAKIGSNAQFSQYDTNNDGTISTTEYNSFHAQSAPAQ